MKLFLKLAHKHSLWIWFSLIVLFLVALRVPNFYEPSWYGDEGIYLTIGNGLRQGKLLYKDIIDHKTPLIYFLAMTPSQESFRLLNLIWMIATTGFFFGLVYKWTKKEAATIIATTGFVLLTTLPWFEGHIPNGELFVMGFVLGGLLLLSETSLVQFVFGKAKEISLSRKDILLTSSAGILFGLGILTKVPAILDFAALSMIWWIGLIKIVLKTKKHKVEQIFTLVKQGLVLSICLVLPIAFSIFYFWTRGSLAEYAEFGLLYNFRYAASWDPGVTHPLAVFYTSLLGKIGLVLVSILVTSVLITKISPVFAFAIVWFMFALMAATLSNRPYPHYFMQIMPPLWLMLGLLISAVQDKTKDLLKLVLSFSLSFVAIAFMILFLTQLDLGLYETQKYYQQYWQLTTGEISPTEYRNSFNYLMNDNYRTADIIAQSEPEEIFIWGTNPMLYALTNTSPTGRFTVAFHIHDFDAYAETLEDLTSKYPEYVVVMHQESELPGLDDYLEANYELHTQLDNFDLFRRKNNF